MLTLGKPQAIPLSTIIIYICGRFSDDSNQSALYRVVDGIIPFICRVIDRKGKAQEVIILECPRYNRIHSVKEIKPRIFRGT